MTKTEKCTELSKRIRKCVPSLMKLSLGCEVKLKEFKNTQNTDTVFYVRTPVHGGNFYCDTGKFGNYTSRFPHVTQVDKIIGHKIELSHVLRAIDFPASINCNSGGEYIEAPNGEQCEYNLSLPFDQQEEALYDFLLEVIPEV